MDVKREIDIVIQFANRLISEMIGTFALVDPSDCACTCASAETQCKEFKEIQCESDGATTVCLQKESSVRKPFR